MQKQPNKQNQSKSYTKENRPILQIWRNKGQVTPSTKANKVANHKNKESQMSVWVKKDLAMTRPKDQQVQMLQQIKHIPSKEMKLWILNLQVLLFGMASIQRSNAQSGTHGYIILVK